MPQTDFPCSASVDSCGLADAYVVSFILQLRVHVALAYVYTRQPHSKQQTIAMAVSYLAN